MSKTLKIVTEKTVTIKEVNDNKLWESDSLEFIPFNGKLMESKNNYPDYMIAFQSKKNEFIPYDDEFIDKWFSNKCGLFDDTSPLFSGNLNVINIIFEQIIKDSAKTVAVFQEIGWSKETGYPVYKMIKYAKIQIKKKTND